MALFDIVLSKSAPCPIQQFSVTAYGRTWPLLVCSACARAYRFENHLTVVGSGLSFVFAALARNMVNDEVWQSLYQSCITPRCCSCEQFTAAASRLHREH
jgi:hypothetical protein